MQKDTRSAVAEYRGGGYVVRMVLRVLPGDPGPPEAGEVEGLSCCRASGPVYQIEFCRDGVRHMQYPFGNVVRCEETWGKQDADEGNP